MSNRYHQAKFIQSAANMDGLPPELGFEVAFAGRSNAGKSSVLNRLCQQKSLARTSKTPGRTQLINYFALPEGRYLVDLPGYGYAKVPEKVRKQWQRFIDAYLEERWTLKGVILLMDIRHPLKNYDQMMLDWAEQKNLAVHVLLNKSDKLKRGAAQSTLLKIRRTLKKYSAPRSVQTFSALNGDGFDELSARLDDWLYEGEGIEADTRLLEENNNES